MRVNIKDLSADIEIKNKGVEMGVWDTNGRYVGDLVVTKTRLIWCQGKTPRDRGQQISWPDFIELMQNR